MIDTLYAKQGEFILVSHSIMQSFYEWIGITTVILLLIVLAYAMGLNKGKKDDVAE